jgi:hypothetical protein
MSVLLPFRHMLFLRPQAKSCWICLSEIVRVLVL